MPKVTWLGEDNLHKDGNGPLVNEWAGIRFEKGKPVEIKPAWMVAKARGNLFYKVDEDVVTAVSGLPKEGHNLDIPEELKRSSDLSQKKVKDHG